MGARRLRHSILLNLIQSYSILFNLIQYLSNLYPNLINSLFNFNPKKVTENYSKEESSKLLDKIIIELKPRGNIRRTKKSEWPKYCRSVIDSAYFLSEFENEPIALITLNAYRVKTQSEIVNEAELLKTEYSKQIKKGRPLKGEVRDGKNWSIVNVSEKLGVSTTKLKKLLSIKNYDPSLLEKVDQGIISVERAYQEVRLKYIVGKDDGKYAKQKFNTQMKRLLEKYNPPFDVVFNLLVKHYPDEMKT